MAESSDATFRRTIVLAQAGDRTALDKLFREIQAPLFRYVRSLAGGDATLSEDILQDVFVLIYRKLAWLEEPAAFLPWCYRIASREAIRRVQQVRGRQESPLAAEVETDAVPAWTFEGDAAKWIERAPAASRPVLALHYLEEFSIEEAAAILGIPAGTAKSRLAYGLKVLREILK
jgi:RNA polymerase sigma-70 factor (ECF subfamily)